MLRPEFAAQGSDDSRGRLAGRRRTHDIDLGRAGEGWIAATEQSDKPPDPTAPLPPQRVLPREQRQAVEIGRPHGQPSVVDDGDLAVHVYRHQDGPLRRICTRFAPPQREDARAVCLLTKSREETFDRGPLPRVVSGNAEPHVQQADQLQVRPTLHRRHDRVNDLERGQVLILDVDVVGGSLQCPQVRLVDAGLALREAVVSAAVKGPAHPERDGGMSFRRIVHGARLSVGRRDRVIGLRVPPVQTKRLEEIGDGRTLDPGADVMHGQADQAAPAEMAPARLIDAVLAAVEVLLKENRAEQVCDAIVDDDQLGVDPARYRAS